MLEKLLDDPTDMRDMNLSAKQALAAAAGRSMPLMPFDVPLGLSGGREVGGWGGEGGWRAGERSGGRRGAGRLPPLALTPPSFPRPPALPSDRARLAFSRPRLSRLP